MFGDVTTALPQAVAIDAVLAGGILHSFPCTVHGVTDTGSDAATLRVPRGVFDAVSRFARDVLRLCRHLTRNVLHLARRLAGGVLDGVARRTEMLVLPARGRRHHAGG